jgi:hypothetical protein
MGSGFPGNCLVQLQAAREPFAEQREKVSPAKTLCFLRIGCFGPLLAML